MLTNKNWVAKTISSIPRLVMVLAALLLAGCQPPGPKSLLLGQKYIEQGDYERALKYLTRASALIPEHPQVWNHLGLAYHAQQQPLKAADAYQRAIRIDRNLPAPHYNLGVLLLEQGHLPQAAAEFNAFVSLKTNSAAGWTKLGTTLVRMKRPDDAERALNNALRLDPKNPEAFNSLGLTHVQRKRPREALLAFNNALQQGNGYPSAILNQAVLFQEHFDNKQSALERYRAYLSTKPDARTAAQVERAIKSLEAEMAPQVAETSNAETNRFSEFLRTNLVVRTPSVTNSPAIVAAATNHATNLIGRHSPLVKTNLPPAVATNVVVAVAASTNPPPPRVTETNVIVSTAATDEPAASEVKEPVPEPETEPEPVSSIEVVRVDKEPDFKAIADVTDTKTIASATTPTRNAAEIKPLFVPRRERKDEEKGGFLSRVNPVRWFKDEAKPAQQNTQLASREQAAPERPSYPPVIKVTDPKPEPPRVIQRYQYRKNITLKKGDRALAQKLFQQGVEAHQQRRLADAMESYQNATTLDQSYFEAHYNLGLAAYQSRNIPLALSENELAVAAKPASVDARFNFALALRDAHYPTDASNELRTLVTNHPDEVRAHFALANIYAQQLDQPELARRHYLAVLELNGNHPEAPSIRQWLATHP